VGKTGINAVSLSFHAPIDAVFPLNSSGKSRQHIIHHHVVLPCQTGYTEITNPILRWEGVGKYKSMPLRCYFTIDVTELLRKIVVNTLPMTAALPGDTDENETASSVLSPL
jgi:hypothetical protein